MKCKKLGFELVSPCSFPMTVTFTSWAPPIYIYIYIYIYIKVKSVGWLIVGISQISRESIPFLLIRWVYIYIYIYNKPRAPMGPRQGRLTKTYIEQLCEDSGCHPEDQLRAMSDREEWWRRVMAIRVTSATWWWWYIYIYIYIYIYNVLADVPPPPGLGKVQEKAPNLKCRVLPPKLQSFPPK